MNTVDSRLMTTAAARRNRSEMTDNRRLDWTGVERATVWSAVGFVLTATVGFALESSTRALLPEAAVSTPLGVVYLTVTVAVTVTATVTVIAVTALSRAGAGVVPALVAAYGPIAGVAVGTGLGTGGLVFQRSRGMVIAMTASGEPLGQLGPLGLFRAVGEPLVLAVGGAVVVGGTAVFLERAARRVSSVTVSTTYANTDGDTDADTNTDG